MQLTTRPDPLPRRVGWVAAGFVILLTAQAVNLERDEAVARLVVGAALALAGAAVLAQVPYRLPVAVAASVAMGSGVVTVCSGDPSNIGWFALCVLIGWAVWTFSYVIAIGLWFAVTVVLIVQAAIVNMDGGWFGWIFGSAFSLFGFAAGRHQRELVLQLREAQAGLAARAQSEERARIARELHDVIAHSLTVSLLHVSSARLALAEDPADADRALAEAERLGRASLDEVRHAVGTLRTGAGATTDPTAPLPGSTDLPALVAGFISAGADVRTSVDGELDTLPATVGLATYRIVQEALTNATKHAPGRPVTVHVIVRDAEVTVDVDSAGVPGQGHGLGVVGMRERAASVGGTCAAGPGGSGWRVHAELPLLAEAP